jgi:ATP-dependent DNA helicase RecG
LSEGQFFDRKSLRVVTGRTADFAALAQDCVCFANGAGGQIALGIEDEATDPPAGQRLDADLLGKIRQRIGELTVNVQVVPEIQHGTNGGEFILLTIPRSLGVASTSDGRYFLRVGDDCQPIVGDDVLRLANERPATPWELMMTAGVRRQAADEAKVADLTSRLRASDRVASSVKEKTDHELLDHYALADGERLTNLGILLIGRPADRARLGSAPVVQAIKYDERGVKVSKLVWDDYTLSPIELVDVVWEQVPDFRESYELPDGMFRTTVPAFEEVVVRELLVNALVHRPYTQRGDIFLNFRPDRLEVVNPGRLPLGVTPKNILHTSRRRNDALARVFHDLKLMEREGSGFDLMYERLLASGRAVPIASEGTDSVHIVVPRRLVQPAVIRLLAEVDDRYHLMQRERIVLGLLAQTEGLLATELAERLELPDPSALRPWLGRLLDLGLLQQGGRTRATRYFVQPDLLRAAGLDGRTTLVRVQPHRLKALVLEDLERFPNSSISDVHRRVAPEVPIRTFGRALQRLARDGFVEATGTRRWRKYRALGSIGHNPERGR